MNTFVDPSPCPPSRQHQADALVAEVATGVGVPVPRVTVRDKPGAAAWPRRGELHLGVDVLASPPEQARAVVAHELTHLHHRDSTCAHVLSLLVGLVTVPLVFAGVLPAPLDGLVCVVAAGSFLLTAWRCRRTEARADRFAARAGHAAGMRAHLEQDLRHSRPWARRVTLRVCAFASTQPRHAARRRSIRSGELMSPLRLLPDARVPESRVPGTRFPDARVVDTRVPAAHLA